jgi:hypothetical protein
LRAPQVFREKAQDEARELSESALGGTLLGLIGTIYVERACAHLSSASSMYMLAGKSVSGWGSAFAYVSWGFSTAWSALEIRSLKRDAARRQEAQDKRNNVSEEQKRARKATAGPVDMNALYGPDATPEVKERVQQKAKKFGGNL